MRKPKFLRALLILLFVAAPIQWTRAQIVLSTPKTTLGAVIKNIKSQSNYQFFYDDKPVSYKHLDVYKRQGGELNVIFVLVLL